MLKKNTYRPDIDGLRALAVLAVVLFHLSPTLLPNGFLGVDMFFVISGFLITTILYREMEQNNFSFANFYNRRIRRILPVCFVVIVVGLLLTRWLFLTKDFYSVANSAVASVFFLSNFYFDIARRTTLQSYMVTICRRTILFHFSSIVVVSV